MDSFDELISILVQRIEGKEERERGRNSDAQKHFRHGVTYLVSQLWKGTSIHDEYEGSINKRSNWYSHTSRYADKNLTFRQTMAAYEGLIDVKAIRETRGGFLDRDILEGELTKFIARDELLSMFSDLKQDPIRTITPNLNLECIVLRDNLDDGRQQVKYFDTDATNEMRENLRQINYGLKRHWVDIRIKDTEWELLQERLRLSPTKQPIDLTKWSLTRIFSNGSFEQGGRFYRAWWHQVPSEYRKYITLDGKRTSEYDFSQLNPHMVYYLRGKDIGEEDAYDRVFDGMHRDIVKDAFNAMMQSSTPLTREPEDIDLSEVDFDWKTLRTAVLNSHKAIEDMFFKGHGNHLQYIDSCMAEQVMLQFLKSDDAPVLPVHDSFIMHWAYGDLGEIEEAMRRAFFNKFKKDIKIREEIGVMLPSEWDEEDTYNFMIDSIPLGKDGFGMWNKRNLYSD